MNETEKKQEELKKWIKKLGITQKYFANQYYIEEYDSLNEEEIKGFYEKFKGHLKRNTTSVDTIEVYLKFLYEMDEFKKKCYIRPNKIEDNESDKDKLFDNEFNMKMEQISKIISEEVEKSSSDK